MFSKSTDMLEIDEAVEDELPKRLLAKFLLERTEGRELPPPPPQFKLDSKFSNDVFEPPPPSPDVLCM